MRLSKEKRTKGHSYMSRGEGKDPAKVTGEELAVKWKETRRVWRLRNQVQARKVLQGEGSCATCCSEVQ